MIYSERRAAMFFHNDKTMHENLIHSLSAASAAIPVTPFLSSFSKYVVFPGFVDVHVHLREPGYFYKERMETGTMAAAAGGYTRVMSMPNLSPVPDSLEHLKVQTDIIERDARIFVHPYGSITKEQKGEALSDMEAMAPFVAGFSDDGRGVQSDDMMRAAMTEAKRLGKIIVAHCEDNSLLHGGYIHDGAYAKAHGHRGISSESEYKQIERDLALSKEIGCAYHVCHISTKESVEIIRKAKAEGVDVTCETAPHYLILDDSCLEEDGRFKMNPPLRSAEDRKALVEGLIDGTIDMIATDHAPHSLEEKSRGLEKSMMGIVGIETAFACLYTYLVKPGTVPLDRVIDALCVRPRERFSLPFADEYCVFDLESEYEIDPEKFISLGRATPFKGHRVFGKCVLTAIDGRIVYQNSDYNTEEK
ncbi:MAG: dihydroorotase [Clostridia bacterium]|nr:dihydroorotase [Clostridia bacterium]